MHYFMRSILSRLPLYFIVLFFLAMTRFAHAGEPSDSSARYLGIGLPNVKYYNGAHYFVDLARSSQFRTLSFTNTVPTQTDGWPESDFLLLITSNKQPAGIYYLTFEGQATVSQGGMAMAISLSYDAATNITSGTVTLATPMDGNTWLSFSNTKRTATSAVGTGVKNIHLYLPGYPTDGSQIFTNEILTFLQKVHTVRAMDWTDTNGNATRLWSERALPSWGGQPDTNPTNAFAIEYPVGSGEYHDRGASWEVLVQLANAADTDLWVCLPARVDEDYMTKLAQLLRYGSDGVNPYSSPQTDPVWPPLNSHLKIYTEIGNEIWNTGPAFYGFYWMKEFSDAERVKISDLHPINHDGNGTDQFVALRRYIAWKSSRVSLRFREVFGDAAMMTRVRPVLASQVADGNAYLSMGLTWAESFYGATSHPGVDAVLNNNTVRSISDIWYAAGGAAYYDPTTYPEWQTADPTYTWASLDPTAMNAFFDGLPSARFANDRVKDALWTAAYGLKLFAYEGGPNAGGSSLGTIDANAEEILEYNRSPRMRERMPIAQEIWDQYGGDLLCYFHLGGGDGPWGFGDTETVTLSNTTAKALALEDMRTTPRADQTYGIPVPASIALPGNADLLRTGNNYTPLDNAYLELRANATNPFSAGTVIIPVRTTAATTAKVRLTYKAAASASADLFLGSTKVGTYTLPASASFTDSASITVNLPARLSGLRLRQTGANNVQVLSMDIIDATTVETPVFSLPAGSYSIQQTISITCSTESSEIRYTTDGSTPTEFSTLYTDPITIENTTTLRAIALRSGWTNSLVRSATYDLSGNIYAGALLAWNFTQSGLNDGSAASVNSNYQRSGVQSSVLSRGPALSPQTLTSFTDRGALGFGSSTNGGPNYSTLEVAKTNGAYLQFVLTPQSGSQLALSGLRVTPFQQNASATATLTAEYSFDGFASAGLPIGTVVSVPGGWNPNIQTLDLSAIADFQSVSTPVTIRLWFHGFSQWNSAGIGMIAGNNLDVGVLGSVKYFVNYLGNGNTGGSVPVTQTKNSGVTLTLATNSGNLAKTGHTFVGWNTAANGSGMTYAEAAGYTADAPLTLYAQWETIPPYTQWIETYPSLSGNQALPTADPDADGMTNLLEYALGENPDVAGKLSDKLTVSLTNVSGVDYLTLSVTKNTSATDVNYIVETSTDLQTWTSGAGNTVILSDTAASLAVRTDFVNVGNPVFLRLRVTKAD